MTEPYGILGLSKDSTADQLRARYNELKAKYSEDRFLQGEAGNEGARKLMELEDAWVLISADIQRKQNYSKFGGYYGFIDGLIKDGKYDEAQSQMDMIAERTAEWHYYQSIIYYKRDWLSESRSQLAMAVSMEPSNKKYSDALEKMDNVMANPRASQQDFNGQGQAYGRGQTDAGNMLCRCCQAYICADCCCSMMRCCF